MKRRPGERPEETAEIDAVAARDAQPDEYPAMRWCRPLVDILGVDEPSDDDREDWIVRDLIPRAEAAIWAGPPKCGKTWAALDLAICVALGRSWLDGGFENTMGGPARVLVIALEDGLTRLRRRVWELARGYGLSLADPLLAAHLSISRETLRLPGDERALLAELRRWRPALVIADCLTRVMAGDQNAIRDVAPFTTLWQRMCSDSGASITFLHHTGKSDETRRRDPFESIRGSGDLYGATRNAIVSTPIGTGDNPVSEIRMRGNLSLARPRFALGFERASDADGRWSARMIDRGDPDLLRASETAAGRDRRESESRKAKAGTTAHRREVAIGLAKTHGCVSGRSLAAALGLTARAVDPLLAAMAFDGTLLADKAKGYVLPPGGAQ